MGKTRRSTADAESLSLKNAITIEACERRGNNEIGFQ